MIDWDSIETVLLDMDGTLLDLHFDNHFWLEHLPLRYAERHGITAEQAKDQLFPEMLEMQGKLEWYCLDYWSAKVDMDIVAMKHEVAHLIAVHPHVLEFLQVCKEHNIKRVLVTNAHRGSVGIKMERTPLAGHLDQIVSSHDLGYPKEEQVFWSALQTVAPFDKDKTLFVDDTERVLLSAKHYGIRHVVGITHADSKQPPKAFEGVDAIKDFSEIMPLLERPIDV